MADDDDATDGTAGSGDDGTEPQAGSGDDAGTQDGAGTDGDELDAKALAAEVKALRRENAKRRNNEKALQAKLDAEEAAKLSDAERIAKENADLKAQLAERDAADERRKVTEAIEKIARAKKAVDPSLVAELLIGKLGEDTDIAEAVDALLTERPFLKAGDSTGSDANGSASASTAAGTDKETDEQRRARIYGGSGSIFDPKTATALGGGVHAPDPGNLTRR